MKQAKQQERGLSLGSRGWKRITPPSLAREPAMMTRPSTSSAFANRLPRIEVCATTTSPAFSAKMTTNSSGRLPSVDCRKPVSPGPTWWPSASVPSATSHARPDSATVTTGKTTSPSTPA